MGFGLSFRLMLIVIMFLGQLASIHAWHKIAADKQLTRTFVTDAAILIAWWMLTMVVLILSCIADTLAKGAA